MDSDSMVILTGSVFATRTGLVILDSITFDAWLQVGDKLRDIEGAVHWWIGDWLNYGERRWGEMYAQALEETGYGYSTLRNDKWVANAVPVSARHDKLSFKHHHIVAALPPDEQTAMLDKAEAEELTTRQLREQVSGVAEWQRRWDLLLELARQIANDEDAPAEYRQACERLLEGL